MTVIVRFFAVGDKNGINLESIVAVKRAHADERSFFEAVNGFILLQRAENFIVVAHVMAVDYRVAVKLPQRIFEVEKRNAVRGLFAVNIPSEISIVIRSLNYGIIDIQFWN